MYPVKGNCAFAYRVRDFTDTAVVGAVHYQQTTRSTREQVEASKNTGRLLCRPVHNAATLIGSHFHEGYVNVCFYC